MILDKESLLVFEGVSLKDGKKEASFMQLRDVDWLIILLDDAFQVWIKYQAY